MGGEGGTDGDQSVQEDDSKVGSSGMRAHGATMKIIFC